MWFVLSIGALLLMTTYSLLAKFILSRKKDNDPVAYAALFFLIISILSGIVYAVSRSSYPDLFLFRERETTLILLADVSLYTLSGSFYYRALKNLPVSQVAIMYSFVGVYSLCIAIVLGRDLLTFPKVVGAGLIITAVWIISHKKGKFRMDRNMILLLLATLVFALASITDNALVAEKGMSPLFLQFCNFGIPAFGVLCLHLGRIRKIPVVLSDKVNVRMLIVNSVVYFFTYFLIFSAYKYGGKASSVNLIISTEAVFIVIFSTFFLKEKGSLATKLFAGILAVIGVILVG